VWSFNWVSARYDDDKRCEHEEFDAIANSLHLMASLHSEIVFIVLLHVLLRIFLMNLFFSETDIVLIWRLIYKFTRVYLFIVYTFR
jgi:uncharacterized protein YqhQ